jgi:hypothetical protein
MTFVATEHAARGIALAVARSIRPGDKEHS